MHEGPALQDRALLEAARAGSADAFRELWRQHHRAAHRYASALTRRFDADDLVSEAFSPMFSALRSGGGPGEALRPYLFVTIRNIAIKWAKQPGVRSLEEIDEPAYDVDLGGALMQAADRQKLQDALGSLPAQWQHILWATEVKGQRPAELAPTLGLQPNSVAALAYRAREALRHAWVQVHMGDDLGDGEHRWVRERAGVTSTTRSPTDRDTDSKPTSMSASVAISSSGTRSTCPSCPLGSSRFFFHLAV